MARFKGLLHRIELVAVLIGCALAYVLVGGVLNLGRALASGPSASLMPAAGQFFPVPPVKVADTRDGTGGVPAHPLAASGTMTFGVTGVGQVPSSGVSDVYVIINAIDPQYNGCLNDYSADEANPSICTVSFESGQNMSDSDIVQVSSSGQISVTNESGGTTDVAVSVMGYFQDSTAPAVGETYVPVPQAQIVDTRSGLGAPQAQVPAGGRLTVQVGGDGGVPGDAAGAALFIGAANATQAGYVSAYPPGGSASDLAMLSYNPNEKVRDLYYGALSSSGQLTLVNNGTAPADLMVGVEGYLVSPSATEGGGEYQDVNQARIVDTRDGTGGVPATPIPAGGSITFTAIGADYVPYSGVLSVAQSVAALSPSASGYLSVYPAGGADPDNPGVSFTSGDYQDNDMATPLSPSGQETITNHSSGAVDVVVSVRGYYEAPTVPAAPSSVSATISGTSATITWAAPPDDGGAAITGYTVQAWPDGATASVSGTVGTATLTGLQNATMGTFTVTAANAVGSSAEASWSPANVVSGTVVAPNPSASPVQGDTVDIFVNDPGADPDPSQIGAATTDVNGNWVFAVPAYAALPADAQAAAGGNGGFLNVIAVAGGTATLSGQQYPVAAEAAMSAWVGTSAGGTAPAASAAPSQPAMVLRPDNNGPAGTSPSSWSQWAASNAAVTSDANDNPVLGDPDNAYSQPQTDAYGYQELIGNGSYNPNEAPDGTDLTNASYSPRDGCDGVQVGGPLLTKNAWTVISEYHSNWNAQGSLTYSAGAVTTTGVEAGPSTGAFSLVGWDKDYFGSSQSVTLGDREKGYESNQVIAFIQYVFTKWQWQNADTGAVCKTWYQWDSDGIVAPSSGGPAITYGANINNDQNSSDTRWRTDGLTALQNLLSNEPTWLKWLPYGFDDCLDHDAGVIYGVAGTIGYEWKDVQVALTVSDETDHSSSFEQCWQANQGDEPDTTREDWYEEYKADFSKTVYDDHHYYWGSDQKFTWGAPGPVPRTFYTY